ncbi:MAG: Nif3-like dinuclear metal center hexameric protein [Fibrobacter sp.]|nr:Nif3-like dinuclear metal center hexameric protein [Fibrobacter sp.]
MKISDFTLWLDELLNPKAFPDYCTDGLCVEASDQVTKVVTGVSFRDRLIDIAIEKGADCIIVHHPNGFWKNEDRVLTGKFGERMRRLMQHGISLYGFHLPLDGHPEIGNNAVIARGLGLDNLQGFMFEGDMPVGYYGDFRETKSQADFLNLCDKFFEHGVQNKFFFGTNCIRRVAVCSGSGASGIQEAILRECDAFVTGEIKESVPIQVEEAGFNLVSAGHHRTEIFGVQSLAKLIKEKLKIDSNFVDIDNPI